MLNAGRTCLGSFISRLEFVASGTEHIAQNAVAALFRVFDFHYVSYTTGLVRLTIIQQA